MSIIEPLSRRICGSCDIEGRNDLFYPYGKTYAQTLGEQGLESIENAKIYPQIQKSLVG